MHPMEFPSNCHFFQHPDHNNYVLHARHRPKVSNIPFEINLPPSPFKNVLWRKNVAAGTGSKGLLSLEIPEAPPDTSLQPFEPSAQQDEFETHKRDAVNILSHIEVKLSQLHSAGVNKCNLPKSLIDFFHSTHKELTKLNHTLEERKWQSYAFHADWIGRAEGRAELASLVAELRARQKESGARGGPHAMGSRRGSLISSRSRMDSAPTNTTASHRGRLDSIISGGGGGGRREGTVVHRGLMSCASALSVRGAETLVISFSLASRYCEKMGWIVRPDPASHLHAQMAVVQLLCQILTAKLQDIHSDKSTRDRTGSKITYYSQEGCHVKSAVFVNSKAPDLFNLPVPRMPKEVVLKEGETVLSVETESVTSMFYPSGRLAVLCVATSGATPGQVVAYGEDGALLALLLGDTNSVFTPDGAPLMTWTPQCYTRTLNHRTATHFWPADASCPLPTPVTLTPSRLLRVKIFSPSSVTLSLRSAPKTTHLPLQKFLEPPPDQRLVSRKGAPRLAREDIDYTSGTALGLESAWKQKHRHDKLTRLAAFASTKQGTRTPSTDSDASLKIFSLLEPFHINHDILPSSLKSLRRLRKRSAVCLEQWLQHYRLQTGVNLRKLVRAKLLGVNAFTCVERHQLTSSVVLPSVSHSVVMGHDRRRDRRCRIKSAPIVVS